MAKRYLEIQKEIQRRITDGEWPVGYKLPRETELCALFDASRTTVRRALSAPVAEGKLRRIKGTGTFVSSPQIFEKTTFFIQSFAEELKNQGLSCETEVLECRTVTVTDKKILTALGLCHSARLFKLRRLRYSKELREKGPITLTVSYFPADIGKLLEDYDFESGSLYRAMQLCHLTRARSEKTVAPTRLPLRDCRLLSAAPDDLFLAVTSVSFDRDGHALEYCESYFPSDRNSFRLHVVTD